MRLHHIALIAVLLLLNNESRAAEHRELTTEEQARLKDIRAQIAEHQRKAAALTRQAQRLDNPFFTFEKDFPIIDGSTTTYPVSYIYASHKLNFTVKWVEFNEARHLVIDDLKRPLPGRYIDPAQDFAHSTTHHAYLNLIDGFADVITVARKPSTSELAAAKQAGVELDVRPFAYDAFVFLLHSGNPLKGLTLEQIRDIYTGKTTGWDALGVADDAWPADLVKERRLEPLRKITPYQRERDSGSQETMIELVMQDRRMVDGPELIAESMVGPYTVLAKNPAGIGYTFYYYQTQLRRTKNVKMLAIDGVAPTPKTIRERKYPLTTEVYVVTRKDAPADSPGVRFRDWLMTPEGQALVQESGYVPVLKPASEPGPAGTEEIGDGAAFTP